MFTVIFRSKRRRRSPRRQCSKDYDCALTNVYNQSKQYDCEPANHIYNQSKQHDCVPANHIYSQSKPAIIQSTADMDIIPMSYNQEAGNTETSLSYKPCPQECAYHIQCTCGQNQTSLYSFLPYDRIRQPQQVPFQPQMGSNMDKQYIYMPCVPKLPQDISEDVVNTEDLHPTSSEEFDKSIPGDAQCSDSCDCQDTQSCHCPDIIPPEAEVLSPLKTESQS